MHEEIRELWEYRSLPERLRVIDYLSQGLRIVTIGQKETWRDCSEIMIYILWILGYSRYRIAKELKMHHNTVNVKIKKAEQMIRDRFPEALSKEESND